MSKYVIVLIDKSQAERLRSLTPTHYTSEEEAKKEAAKIAKDLNTPIMVCEVIGIYRPTVHWEQEGPVTA